MEYDELCGHLWKTLYADLDEDETYPNKRPFLAHYTSLEALEGIVSTNQLWLSNPLFMNDLEEVRFGINHCARIFKEHSGIHSALGSDSRVEQFNQHYDYHIKHYEKEHLFNTYVFCLSEHDPEDYDGNLSMWRGYGGDGSGAAIIFDTNRIPEISNSPLRLAVVKYGSEEERLTWFENAATRFADVVAELDLPDESLFHTAFLLFDSSVSYALFSKHIGFRDEKEWRVVYYNILDPAGKLKEFQNYSVTTRGIEPKLRVPLKHIEGITPENFSLDEVVDQILLGPSSSSELAIRSIEKMLDVHAKTELKNLIVPTTIPYRKK